MMELAAQEVEDRKPLEDFATDAYAAIMNYVQFVTAYFGKSPSKLAFVGAEGSLWVTYPGSRVASAVSGAWATTRRELRTKIDIAFEKFNRRFDMFSRAQLLRQQREATEAQKEATNMQKQMLEQRQDMFEVIKYLKVKLQE